MTTKEKILKLFETSRDVYFSGEDEKAEIKWVNDIFVRDK